MPIGRSHQHTHTHTGRQSGLVLTHTYNQGHSASGANNHVFKKEILASEKRAFDALTWCFERRWQALQFNSRLFINLHFWCWREKWVPRPGLLVQMLLGFCRSAFTNWQKVTPHARFWRAFRWFCRERVVNGKKPAISLLYLLYLVRFSSHGRGWLYCWELLMHKMIM